MDKTRAFCEVDSSTGVCISVIQTPKEMPAYPNGNIGLEIPSYDESYIGGHYNGTTVDKCPAGKVWDVVTKSFIAA